ncbi:MAG: hypothetical protein VB085_07195 [Peptococcaceae bacterium]|nr:hypothetical protein [Peptococcaceae bacterium]
MRQGKMDETPMKTAYLLPTGNEIQNGIVLDLDTPELMIQLIRRFPQVQVTRLCPLLDDEEIILRQLEKLTPMQPDLIVLIGGSGGGHRFSKTLSRDFTHSALERFLDEHASREIYGKNGHLWCKLLCGKKGVTLVINVPGPFVEAKAAFSAFLESWSKGDSLEMINSAMAQAVFAQYPAGAAQTV